MNNTVQVQNSTDEWVTIDEFPNYEITIDGKIRHKTKKKIRQTPVGKRGYPVVSLKKDGKLYLRTVHSLLGKTFIPNPGHLPEINHIDGNKLNFDINNLEWCTQRENNIHARRTGLHKTDGDIPVSAYLNGVKIATFKSMSEAHRQTGANRSAIGKVAAGLPKYKTAGGYEWKYEQQPKRNKNYHGT